VDVEVYDDEGHVSFGNEDVGEEVDRPSPPSAGPVFPYEDADTVPFTPATI
jgi:hypothetical protein